MKFLFLSFFVFLSCCQKKGPVRPFPHLGEEMQVASEINKFKAPTVTILARDFTKTSCQKRKRALRRGEKLLRLLQTEAPSKVKMCCFSQNRHHHIKQRTCLYHAQRFRLPLQKVSLEILSCIQWTCTVKQSGEQIQVFMFLHFFRMSLKSGPFLSQVFSSILSAVVGEGPAWGTRRKRRA